MYTQEQFVTMGSQVVLSRVTMQFIKLKERNSLMSLVIGPKNMYPLQASRAFQAHLSKTNCFNSVLLARMKKLKCFCLALSFQGS